MTFYSTKTYTHSTGLSCAFRQWRADSHCKFLHGYALQIKLTFAADKLDDRNWVVDFGDLKAIKKWLEDMFDHKTLVADDDPKFDEFVHLDRLQIIQLRVVPDTGCEAFAYKIFQFVNDWLKGSGYHPRCKLKSVEVREHEGNSAIYEV
jgi:6-pyruvoyltetrahydropterin/6-carboxytetrahydropterin synthase